MLHAVEFGGACVLMRQAQLSVGTPVFASWLRCNQRTRTIDFDAKYPRHWMTISTAFDQRLWLEETMLPRSPVIMVGSTYQWCWRCKRGWVWNHSELGRVEKFSSLPRCSKVGSERTEMITEIIRGADWKDTALHNSANSAKRWGWVVPFEIWPQEYGEQYQR